MTVPATGQVLGIDIGYAETLQTTGACLLSWTPDVLTCRVIRMPTDDQERASLLKKLIGDTRLLCAALDAPIRGAFDEIRKYRDAEMMLTRQFQSIGKPGQASSGNGIKLNNSANAVANILCKGGFLSKPSHNARISEDHAIVEAFPTTFLGVMLDSDGIPPHGPRSDAYFDHLLGSESKRPKAPSHNRLALLLSRLLPNRAITVVLPNEQPANLNEVMDHEDRAALICAITAVCVVARQYVAVGDKADGYIILPPKAEAGCPGLQPWAWKLLEKNRPTGQPDAIVVES